MSRGLAPSRERAREVVLAGRVLVGGAPAPKPDRQVAPSEPIVVLGPPPRFVGRGGHKLEAALDAFGVEVRDRRAIDVGASTGGFTDCLLQRGAIEVAAIDVGYGQLHERLRSDPRVRSFERCNVRSVDVDAVGGPAPVVVVDVSFISLRTVAPALVRLGTPHGDLVALVKPQFEAGRVEVSRGGGVIREPEVWRRVLGEALEGLRAAGAGVRGAIVSPLTGASGNVEFLVWARRDAEPGDEAMLDVAVADAVAMVSGLKANEGAR